MATIFGQYEEVFIAYKVPLMKDGFHVVAREIAMKAGFSKGEMHTGKYYPLVNLDLFLMAERQVGGDLRMLPAARPEISVVIPFKYIARVTRLSSSSIVHMTLVFWNSSKGAWMDAKAKSAEFEIMDPVVFDDCFHVRIQKWPLDDLIIGCC